VEEKKESTVDEISYLKGGEKLAKAKEVKPTMAELLDGLRKLADNCIADATKIDAGEHGANTACARVRKSMQLIKKIAQQIRTESQALKNNRRA